MRRYDYSASAWGNAVVISDVAVGSRRPSIAHDGTQAWIGYETSLPGATGIELGQVVDEGAPWTTVSLGSTTWSGTVDVQVLHEAGKTWVSWVDSASNVSWAEYDAATDSWGTTQDESYASDSVVHARKRIREEVLGL